MRLLLDTHVAVWWFNDPAKVRPDARDALEDASNEALLSAASVWEAALKQASGRLNLPIRLDDLARSGGLVELAISWEHSRAAAELPRLHGDPFDRMLVAQALLENLVLVTRDRAVAPYDVATMPA